MAASVHIETLAPLDTKKVPVLWADWDQSECVLEIDFAKKCIVTKFVNNTVWIIYGAVS